MDDYYDNNDFDVNEFNRLFKENQDKKEEKENVEKLEYLKSLEKKEKVKSISELTIKEIIYNFKNENLDLIYDLFTFNYSSLNEFYNLFNKNNRLFYFGLLLLIICFVFYIFLLVFSESYDSNININIPNDYNFNHTQNDNELNKLKKDFNELNKKLDNLKNKSISTSMFPKINLFSKDTPKISKDKTNIISKDKLSNL